MRPFLWLKQHDLRGCGMCPCFTQVDRLMLREGLKKLWEERKPKLLHIFRFWSTVHFHSDMIHIVFFLFVTFHTKWRLRFCYKLNCVSRNSNVKVLILNVSVFGDRAFKRSPKLTELSNVNLFFTIKVIKLELLYYPKGNLGCYVPIHHLMNI